MPMQRILSVSIDPILLCTRNMILEQAGYTVTAATSARQAIECFETQAFELVILCHAIPHRSRLAMALKQMRPGVLILMLEAVVAEPDAWADESIESLQPRELLASVCNLLKPEKPKVLRV